MTKKLILTLTMAAMIFMVVGCGDDDGTRSQFNGPAGLLSSAIPAGAVLESATLNLYVWQVSNQTVNVHRVTDYWEEMTITWNSFGGAYAAPVDATIPVTAETWTSTDVTALVQAWLDGTYANHGFLLEQGTAIPRSIFFSRDYFDLGKVPYLEVCYYEGGSLVCEQLPAIADSDIWELNPDDNWGAAHTLRAGWDVEVDWTKMTLIEFDLPQAPPEDCGDCDGKITALNLEYQGAAEAFVEVFSKGHHGDQGEVLFSGSVLPGGNFDVLGFDRHGTMGTEIYLYVDGVLNTQIHTSCSQPIFIGMVSGAFEVLDGYSRRGGRLCPGDGGGNGGDECSECDGKVTELTLAYSGAAEATIEVFGKGKHHKPGPLLFSGPVLPGGSFNFVGNDKKGTMGTEIYLYVDGALNTQIHTSCSRPIYIGMVSGAFEVLDGYSKNGGQFCPDDGGNGGDDENCSECDGKITELTLAYNGAAEALIEVYKKGHHGDLGDLLYSGQVLAGGMFNFVGNDRHGTVGTEIHLYVDGSLNTQIHTSCSRPIYIGMVSGDFEVIDGYSRNGGRLCPVQ